MHTDASQRFERGVDPRLQERAMERATQLLLDVAGGRPGPTVITQEKAHLPARSSILLDPARVERILGIDIPRQEIESLLPVVVPLLAVGPIFSGLLLTALLDGRAGLREFAARLLRWRVGLRWYAVALLLTPLLAALTLGVLSLFSPVFVPGILVSGDKAILVISALAAGLVAGLFEEPGWTGFVTPKLRQRYGLFTAGLILGAMWGFWHLIVAVWGSGITRWGCFHVYDRNDDCVFLMEQLKGYYFVNIGAGGSTRAKCWS